MEAGIYQRDFNHTFKFFPDEDLLPGHRYTAVVTPALRDHAGRQMARPLSWSFVTTAGEKVR